MNRESPASHSSAPGAFAILAVAALALSLGGCTGDLGSGDASGLEAVPLKSAVRAMEKVEELSEAVANRLVEFSDELRKRDYAGARAYLCEDFLGTSFTMRGEGVVENPGLGTRRSNYEFAKGAGSPVSRDAFLDSLEGLLAPLESIDRVFFKTRGAEFEADGSRGLVRLTVDIIGRGTESKPVEITGWARGEVVQPDGRWLLRRFRLERLRTTTRKAPIFTDVAASAKLAHVEPRLGSPENASFYWRGAATADVDGDGRFDIFTSGSSRNFLYRNRGDGTFEDITAAAGLLEPAGVTGPLFFDYDRDGDPDLFCGHVGWLADGVPHGESLHLYRNEGGSRFVDVSAEVGLASFYMSAFGVCAADVDNDGWLDLYVCNYNRLDAVYPDSWHGARNGTPNLLLRNVESGDSGARRFEDVASNFGVAGRAWSYAASFADFDEDGDQDLYVANDYGDNALYVNRGDGSFENRAAAMGILDTGNGMGVTWADLNNDGRLDLYVSNMSSSAGNRILRRLAARSEGSSSKGPGATVSSTETVLAKLAAGNTIFLQKGNGFEALPSEKGGVGASWAWSASILDIDLDGLQDIYVANGFISGDSLKDT